jgi:phage repressor protein C with HTH and peptisase S24 domain
MIILLGGRVILEKINRRNYKKEFKRHPSGGYRCGRGGGC